MRWTAAEIAQATGGVTHPASGDDVVIDGVTIDSRTVTPGRLFVPVRAERDGHDWIPAAVVAGAAAYLTERPPPSPPLPAVAVQVPDTGRALLDLGRAGRHRLQGPVVGITGSVGKTSTKDLAAAALGTDLRVAASERSFNNELGVPLTLVNAPGDTEVAVLEMGARGPGHIRLLCEVAQPTIGVVTAVAPVHTETFGSVDAVALAKAELVEALPAAGTAILNADDHRVAAMADRTRAAVIRWSSEGRPDADVVAENVRVDPSLRAGFTLRSPWGTGPVSLEVRGAHQVSNALAAATVALVCGVGLDDVCAGLARGRLSPWRMEVTVTPEGAVVVNDSYNANPVSVAAALRSLAALPASRRIAVLGPMAELGAVSVAEHRRVTALATELGIEVVAVTTDLYGTEAADSIDAAVERIGPLGPGTALLVKGSRVAGLERLVTRLTAG